MAPQSPALTEIEAIEVDDSHHEFGGGHGTKGHDFAHFWLITRLIELETASASDYLFLCEYVQDVAEFDSSLDPTEVVLYQLKKRETGYWSLEHLTGQSQKSGMKKDRPLIKLQRSVSAFKVVTANGAFVSDMPFDVPLSTGEKSNNYTEISLNDLEATTLAALKADLAKDGMAGDISALKLHVVALDVNDLQVHTTGKMMKFLEAKAPDHVAQASSLVDTLYLRIKGASRVTNKCKAWSELMKRRGLARSDFVAAVQALRSTPDRAGARLQLLDALAAKLDWRMPVRIRITQALADCSRDKILVGSGNRWDVERTEIEAICHKGQLGELDEVQTFNAVKSSLSSQTSGLTDDQLSALAIWEIITAWTQKLNYPTHG